MDYFQITCGKCGAQLTVGPDHAERVTNEASAQEYFRRTGWIVGAIVADCSCPQCSDLDYSSQMVVRIDDRHDDDILKCPFCGGNGLVRAVVRRGYEKSAEDDPDRLAWYIVCHACAAQGGWSKTKTGAVRLWQMRKR